MNEAAHTSWSKQELLEVAKWQKYVILMILFFFVVHFGLPILCALTIGVEAVGVLMLLAVLAHVIVQAYLGYKLAVALRSELAVLYPVFVIIPYVGIIVLLVLNGKATNRLRASRIRVGLMGAKMADLA